MIILSLISRANKKVAPKLLAASLKARHIPALGVFCDIVCLPFLQRIISIEAQDDALLAQLQAKEKEAPSLVENANESPNKSKKRLFQWMDSTIEVSRRRLGRQTYNKNLRESLGDKADSMDLIEYNSLVRYLRPALLPTESFKDIKSWRENYAFVDRIKRELLVAKYKHILRKAIVDFPELDPKNRHQKLPSRNVILRAFNMISWSHEHHGYEHETKRIDELCSSLGGRLIKLSDGVTVAGELFDDSTSLSNLSLDDAVELAGGFIHARGPFNVYCEEANIYEAWTSDYVTALSKYLFDKSNEDTVIIEIGAGDGLLSKFVRESMKELQNVRQTSEKLAQKRRKSNHKNDINSFTLPHIAATDDGSWNIKAKAEVQSLNVSDALKKYCDKDPTSNKTIIVLCAWMPQGIDWTEAIRKYDVDEYILIGESDNGSCGDKWLTWGNPEYSPKKEHIAPHIIDGYVREDLTSLSILQLSRYDGKESRSSNTVSFRKAR